MPTESNPESPNPNESQPPPLEQEPLVTAEIVTPVDARGNPVREQPPVRLREILAVVALVVLADVTIFRAHGFAGYVAFFVLAPLLFLLGAPRPRFGVSFWVLSLMLILLVAKMLWCGSWLLVASGVALLVAFATALSGLRPYVLDTVAFALQTPLAGYEGLNRYRRSTEKLRPGVCGGIWLEFGLPAAALVAFGLLFILANPDMLVYFGKTIEWAATNLRDWLLLIAPSWEEALFWLAVLWVCVGLLRPVVTRVLLEEKSAATPPEGSAAGRASLYSPFRNTLVTLVGLFAIYLVFEFWTLWFQPFPEGFHYSGYAHEGAAWLTVALALATVILSLIFQGPILQDARLGRLRRLAWVWSLENMLLAVAVYHRLYIYVVFNGMTWMRTVAIFGMSCVVVGFVLVVWKIIHNRDFVWLMRRHLWALALTVYLFALTPVDTIVHTYNVWRILSGDPAPSVQISEHPISSEGVLVLIPLTECTDETIREGVCALLARHHEEAEMLAQRRKEKGWTAYQLSDRLVIEGLRAQSSRWTLYNDRQKRDAALERFHNYAYQWW